MVLGELEKKIIRQREGELSPLIKTDHLNLEQSEAQALKKVTREYNDVFQLESDPLRRLDDSWHCANQHKALQGSRGTPARNRAIGRHFGRIEFNSTEFESIELPILLLVSKRSEDPTVKKWRLCVDYRKLNEVTEKIVTPFPRISDILGKVRKVQMVFLLRHG